MTYLDLSLEELIKDIDLSKKILPYLYGQNYKNYEIWIKKKEDRVKELKNKEERG